MTAASITFKRSNPRELPASLAGKLLLVVLALMLVMGLVLTSATKAFANAGISPAIKGNVVVTNGSVKLGDVFENVQQNADFVLAPAPQPGEELVWNEATLLRIATAFNMPWRPESGQEVRIRRDATLIDRDTLKSVLRDHLTGLGDPALYQVNLTSEIPEIIVSNKGTPRIDVADFNMQPVGGTFSALIRVSEADGSNSQTVNVRGVADRVVSVPVLKADKRNGEVITSGDITYITRKATTVGANVVRSPGEMIGSTPRRAIAAGTLITPNDLQMPQMVSRGDLITMVYKQGGMYLTVKGRALEDGAIGQSIKVSNTGSNRTLEGRVTATKQVTIN